MLANTIKPLIAIMIFSTNTCNLKKDSEDSTFLSFKLGATFSDFGKDIELPTTFPSDVSYVDTFKVYNYRKREYIGEIPLDFHLFFKNDSLVRIIGFFFSPLPENDAVFHYIIQKYGNPTNIFKVYDPFSIDSVKSIEWHKKNYWIKYRKESNSKTDKEKERMRIYIEKHY